MIFCRRESNAHVSVYTNGRTIVGWEKQTNHSKLDKGTCEALTKT